MIRSLPKKYARNFAFFYRYLGPRIFVSLALTSLVGLLDGFGLAMFLPLLGMVGDTAGASSVSLGKLDFILVFFTWAGIPLTLTSALMIILFFFTLKGVAKFISLWVAVIHRQFFIRKVRSMAIHVLSRFDYARFVRSDAGRIQNTLSGEVGRVALAYQSYVTMAQDAVLILVYVVLAFLANFQFAILVAIGGILSNIIFSRLYVLTKEKSREITRQGHGYQGLLIQFVAFFKYLKATGAAPAYANKLVKRTQEIEHTNRAIGTLEAVMQGLREPLLIAVVVGVILIQVHVLGGQLGLILLSILFFYRALSAVMQVQMHYNKFLAASGALENITSYLDELNEGREENGSVPFPGLCQGLALDHVHYGYDNQPLLRDLSLSIRKNETIAFVGESGSGKTTVMNLLAGILNPDQGAVLVDGVDLRTLDRRTFQSRIGYITQEPVIFNDTIFNNVTFWDEKNEANLQRFRQALARAHILPFIEAQPLREDALLGNNGINLSGGQRQRISIARELYKQVDFLFMDEATSALDSETERAIQENIDELKGQYTIVIVAHRLSTIRNVDRVVMLREGRIESIATYDDLLSTSPAFRRMVELQEV